MESRIGFKLCPSFVNEYSTLGDIKLHAYKTNDFIDDEVFIVEKNGKAVIIESPCLFDNIKELTEYLKDVKVEGMLVAYHSCLELADKKGLNSIAFCCISTGEFHFPNDKAAQTAIEAVKKYKEQAHSKIKVILNVFKEYDYNIYRELLEAD